MRIELLGPSGVGKTTVISRALELRPDPAPWLGPAECDGLIDINPKSGALRKALDDPALRDFVDHCISTVADSPLSPSQKVKALELLTRSCYRSQALAAVDPGVPLVHDELLLHRAFSLLVHSPEVERDAEWYFKLVPLPEAVVLISADPDRVVDRIRCRGPLPNVYLGRDDSGLRALLETSATIANVAARVLTDRGASVSRVDADGPLEEIAQALLVILDELRSPPTTRGVPVTDPTSTPQDPLADIQERLLRASGSFRKKAGRHELRTRDVVYCAFDTPGFSIPVEVAQRDAAKRVAHFGLGVAEVAGRSVLDLGANAGAMLFQVSNLGPARGLGIEYDVDKVELANEIAEYAGLASLRFEQGDIDLLDPAELGVYDIVFALAIEAHVQDPDRLYTLLGKVTGDILCFEGNHRCDMDEVRDQLTAAGFSDFVELGFCDDDRDPRNNQRPQLLARRKQARPRLWERLRRR